MEVMSTTALDEEGARQAKAVYSESCPRELLGLACLVSQYACLCEVIEVSIAETVMDGDKGEALLKLSMSFREDKRDVAAVMGGIDLTGYRANYQSSKDTVIATFNLRGPHNLDLRLFVTGTASRQVGSPREN